MNILKIILAVILGIAGLYFIIINAIITYKVYIKKEAMPSITPFLGGILVSAAILIVFREKWFLIFIPLVLDLGCIPTIVGVIYLILKELCIKGKK